MCPDCAPHDDHPRWIDENGGTIRQSEIVMPLWPSETKVG